MGKVLTPKQLLLLKQSAANEQSRRIVEKLSAEAAPQATGEAEKDKHQWRILTQAGRKRKHRTGVR